jgi:hypothetical protein
MKLQNNYLPILSQRAVPALIIRLGKPKLEKIEIEDGYFRNMSGYSEDMSELELYDSGRAWWKISEKRLEQDQIRYFVLSFQRTVLGVFEIEKVLRRDLDNRKALTGFKVDSGRVFDQYSGTDGKQIVFPKNSANPVYYWPPT